MVMHRMLTILADPCAGTVPTPTIGTVTSAMQACSGNGMVFTIPWSGMTFGTFVIDIYRKKWQDSESEPGSFTFWKRVTSGTSTTEPDDSYGSDGGGGSETQRRKYQLQVVPASSSQGSGPACHTSADSNQRNQAGNLCFV